MAIGNNGFDKGVSDMLLAISEIRAVRAGNGRDWVDIVEWLDTIESEIKRVRPFAEDKADRGVVGDY